MKRLLQKLTFAVPVVALTPLVALAARADLSGIERAIRDIGDIVGLLIPIVAGIALLAFFFGLAKYIFQADDEDARKKGKEIMIAGIVSLFLIAAIGGIIEVLGDILGVDADGEGITPTRINSSGGFRF
ncbi:MAG: hypothetical protein WD552_02255 [Candidatus Paceibacterota bacterium]